MLNTSMSRPRNKTILDSYKDHNKEEIQAVDLIAILTYDGKAVNIRRSSQLHDRVFYPATTAKTEKVMQNLANKLNAKYNTDLFQVKVLHLR